ncbi:tyrosine-type recombinase/integrase [Paenibacillus sp. P3E]|uniref:tyrosine-type recombinase/integrase n=1 Tax=Paenibacillus sp. P3E TaxID=1349435 RepID=UPI002116864A|nr:tyrosine-type recombinase/integrase [Paenibacillus sp. P3E]
MLDLGKKPDGSRNQKKKGGFDTKDDAEAAAAIILSEFAQGTFVQESNILFKDFTEKWLEHYKIVKKIKPPTLRNRNYEIKKLNKYFAHCKMKSITGTMYQDALNDLFIRGKSTKKGNEIIYSGLGQNTIDGIHVAANMIFAWAVEKKIIKEDPTEYAHVPRKKQTVEELEKKEEVFNYLEKEELSLFLETARTKGLERDYVIFMMLAYTGMRVGELCALKWKDINFTDKRISITKTLYNPSNNVVRYELLTPKTSSSNRIIEIDDDLIKVLEEHRSLQNEIKMKYRNVYKDNDFVIAKMISNHGAPENLNFIQHRTARILKLANLNPSITPHKFRHTHVSLLAELDISLEEIMERLGHQNDGVTKQVYLHVTKARKKEAPRRFSEMMRSL